MRFLSGPALRKVPCPRIPWIQMRRHVPAFDLDPLSLAHSVTVPGLACSKSAGACCVGIRTSVWGNGGLSSGFLSWSSSSLGFGSLAKTWSTRICHLDRMTAYRMPCGWHVGHCANWKGLPRPLSRQYVSPRFSRAFSAAFYILEAMGCCEPQTQASCSWHTYLPSHLTESVACLPTSAFDRPIRR